MPPTIRNATRVADYLIEPLTATVQAVAGDLLVAVAGYDYGTLGGAFAAPTTNAGTLTQRAVNNAGRAQVGVWTRPVTTTGAHSVSLGANGNDSGIHIHLFAITGHDAADPVAAAAAATGTGASQVAPSVTAPADSLLLCGFQDHYNGARTKTGPAGMTYVSGPEADGARLSTASETITAAGATGTRTATNAGVGSTSTWAALSTVIRAAGGATPAPITGAGALTAAARTLAGAGTVTTPAVTGTGALTRATPTLAGAGTLRATGVGALTRAAPAVAGAGVLRLIGAGGFAAAAGALAGSGSLRIISIGELVASPAVLAGSGTLRLAGSGALTAAPPVLAGTAALTERTAGTGTLTAAPPQLAGAGLLTLTGTGLLHAPVRLLAADGTLTLTGAGVLATEPGLLTAVGTVVDRDAFRDLQVTVGRLHTRTLTAGGLRARVLSPARIRARTLTVETDLVKLRRADQQYAHVTLTAALYDGAPVLLDTVDVALLSPGYGPGPGTPWRAVPVEGGELRLLLAGPDATADGAALVVPYPAADLWVRSVDSPETVTVLVERVTVV